MGKSEIMGKIKMSKFARKLKRKTKNKEPDFENQIESIIGFDFKDEPVCLICRVGSDHLTMLEEKSFNNFKLGDWFVSTGHCESLEIHGPFKSSSEGLDFCQKNISVEKFTATTHYMSMQS